MPERAGARRRLRCRAARRRRRGRGRRRACRRAARSSTRRARAALPVVGDIELFARAAQRAGGRHHRHQRQEHRDHAGRQHGARAPAGACASAATSATPALDLLDPRRRAVRARAVELPARDHRHRCTLAAAVRAQRDARSPRPLRRRWPPTRRPRRGSSPRCDTAVVNADDPLVAAMAAPARHGASASRCAARAARTTRWRREGGRAWLARRGEPLLPLGEHAHRRPAQRRQRAGGAGARRGARPAARGDARGAARIRRAAASRRSGSPTSPACATSTIPRAPTSARRWPRWPGFAGPLLLIAGGDGKGQDFTPLRRRVRAARCGARC